MMRADEDVSRSIPAGTRVFVTGGTGFTGSVLVRQLIAQGARVSALVRPGSRPEALRHLQIEWIEGDIRDKTAVERGMAGAVYVFHLASSYRDLAASAQTHEDVHLRGTQHVAAAALREPSLRRVVHVSTIGVHGDIEEPPADETYRMQPDDAYQRSKAAAEVWIREFANREGLSLTVVRPVGIFGPGDRRLFKLFKWAAIGWVPVVGHGRGLLHFIHVEDLGDFLRLAAVHPGAEGEVFICGGARSVTLKQTVEIIGEVYGVHVKWVRLPERPLLWLAGLCEAVCRPFGVTPPLARRRVAFYTKNRAFNTDKMVMRLGFRALRSGADGLRATARWYLEAGWLTPSVRRPVNGASASRRASLARHARTS